jgi:rod shape-determining protein MreC
MRSLLNFLARYSNLIIFLFLEGIAIYMLANGNNYHNARITNGIKGLTRGLEGRVNYTHNYLKLREINDKLAAENVALKNSIVRIVNSENSLYSTVNDTIYHQQYIFHSAAVVDNSVNLQKNFITVDKGRNQGISADMALISGNSVAGVITGCSGNFSIAMSVLNLDFKLSAKIKSNGYFGSISWDGRNPRYVVLSEIPQHVSVAVGDTIVTTGYSAVFPEGILVGTVSDFEKTGGDFYKIRVLLATDFKKLSYVEIIGNLMKSEQTQLENSVK